MAKRRGFAASERDMMASRLEKSLGPEYLSVRMGCGNVKLTYVEGWLIISLANRIFGFDGWSSKMREFTQEYCDMSKDGRVSIGYSCCCRVTLKDGTYKEDTGFGSAEGQKMKGLAIEKARKEAVTDALKRALRQFGNALGNCCYDKEFVKNVGNLKKAPLEARKLLAKSDFKPPNNRDDDYSLSFDNDLLELNNSLNDATK